MSHLRLRTLRLLVLPTLAAALSGQDAEPQPALRGLDPVRLTEGREVSGRADLTATSGRYLYRFESDATRERFRADVGRYEIQLGGGCARMGPLSGAGDKDRYWVHDGRIYIFASDACRDTFKKQAERFLDPDDAAPAPTPEQAHSGKDLLDRAVRAHGGADRLGRLTTYRHRRENDAGTRHWRVAVRFPDHARLDTDIQGENRTWRYAKVLAPHNSFALADGWSEPMHVSGQRDMRRTLLREPLPALRAALTGGAIAVGRGKAVVEGVAVDRLELWIDGCSTTFGIGQDGLIRTASCRGRGPQLWFGERTQVFDDYVERGGVMVPTSMTVWFDGQRGSTEKRLDVEVDVELPAGLFEAK